MTKDAFDEAVAEAQRFIRAAKRVTDNDLRSQGYHNSIEIAAAKRASMDLTRALARMRKP